MADAGLGNDIEATNTLYCNAVLSSRFVMPHISGFLNVYTQEKLY